MMLARCLLIVS